MLSMIALLRTAIAAVALGAVALHAAVPSTLGYQGVLTDNSGVVVADGSYSVTFKLYNVSTAGAALWTETQTVTTTNGVFSAVLGSVTALGLAFDVQYWLGISVAGGAELTPRVQLTSSPYAFTAKTSESGGGSGNTLDGAYDQGGAGSGRTITADAGAVEIGGTEGLLVTGTFGSGTIAATGAGTRLMWYPKKAAFRVGNVTGTQWDDASIGDYSSVGGGKNNSANASEATVGGGDTNTASAAKATVGGGISNTASGLSSSVGGGDSNTASGGNSLVGGGKTNTASSNYSTVGGGQNNQAITNSHATVGGGSTNTASGSSSTVTGGNNNAASNQGSAIGGGSYNTSSAFYSTVAGGNWGTASGNYSTVGGGHKSTASGISAVVSGGESCLASGNYNAVGGGENNIAHTGTHSTIAGGNNNSAAGTYAAIGGGIGNSANGDWSTIAGGDANSAGSTYTAVGGGKNNNAGSAYCAVAGGFGNTAMNNSSAVGGGLNNTANGAQSTVAGGNGNTASSSTTTVSGGSGNTASGGDATVAGGGGNTAGGFGSAIGGGENSTASGSRATVPGGDSNAATGDYSFAAGRRAKANHNGAFVWGDQTDADFASTAVDQFLIRASGGVGIGTTGPGAQLEVVKAAATVAIFNRTTDDGTIISLEQDGTEEGTISVAVATVSYNAFTGSHYAWTDQSVTHGTLVSLTGDNRRLHGDPNSEILYGIAPCARANDPAILGAYLSLQEPAQPADLDNPHLVMAVGNGVMWVVDTGEDITIGDYLISSGIAGHAMRDAGEHEVSHIVARAAEPVSWHEVTETVEGRRHRKISVFFESFAHRRGTDRARLDRQQALIEAQQSELLEQRAVIARQQTQLRDQQARIDALASAIGRLEALFALSGSAEPPRNGLSLARAGEASMAGPKR